MALTRNEFKVLQALARTGEPMTQRGIAEATGLSLGSVNTAVRSCSQQGFSRTGASARRASRPSSPTA